MISNTLIHNGFARINTTGKYFNIVSAGGIVEVELLRQGQQVLKSKMWVGMNLGHPIDFDEIVFRGDNGIVEFWASQVSMSQSSTTIKGANAIRTSQVNVLGSKQITGGDLTRTAVRIRASKEVFIGGAGVNGSGWRVPANSIEEIPVAGVLNAYRQLPTLDIDASTFTEQLDTAFPSTTMSNGQFWISDDGKTRLQWKETNSADSLRIWTEESGVWAVHPSFATMSATHWGVIHDSTTNNLYLVRGISRNVSGGGGSYADGEFYIHISKDNGRTFKALKTINWGDVTNAGLVNNSFTTLFMNIINGVLSINMSGVAVGLDLGSLEFEAYEAGSRLDFDGTVSQSRYWLSNWIYLDNTFKRAYVRNNVTKKLELTEDGGKTFVEVIAKSMDTYKLTPNGEHLVFAETHTKYGYLVDLSDMNPLLIPDFSAGYGLPDNVFNGVWVGFFAGNMTLYYRVGDEVKYDRTTDNNNFDFARTDCLVKPDGTIWRQARSPSANNYITDKWQLAIDGEISPALVEVMELLG